jgi:hypothetical protein
MNTFPKVYRLLPLKPWLVLAAGLICGAVVWWHSVPITGVREPFDSAGLYYPIAMFLAGIFATLPAPHCWWMAVSRNFLGRATLRFFVSPREENLVTVRNSCEYLIFSWLPAALGAASVYFVYHQFNKRVG